MRNNRVTGGKIKAEMSVKRKGKKVKAKMSQ
jgi:hypothetical protein